jgi:ribonuclease T2
MMLGAALVLALWTGSARAEMEAEGTFTASRACPALQSIRKDTNPGQVMTEPGTGYAIIAKNRKKPTYYRIEVPGASPPERWVEASCGKAEAPKSPAAERPKKTPPDNQASSGRGASFVLAISWQPAFCEGNPRKRECRSQRPDRFDASHFSLHGLWPQPGTNIYCGVSGRDRQAATDGRWGDLPPLDLDLATQAALERMMPGSQSYLDRYEWVKHGTCYPVRQEETYYRDSVRLLEAINGSPVRDLFARSIGREVSVAEIRARFDQAFGPGAGERVRVACRDDGGRRLIAELTIGLRGYISSGIPVADLIRASSPTDPGCPGGVVDAVGLQ